jgi:hypothetical protein
MSSKTREALSQLLGLIDNEILVFSNELDPSEISNAQYQIDKAGEAYEKPLRNCDVGTAKQQKARFDKFCDSHSDCNACPLADCDDEVGCTYAFMQRTYESEIADEQ